MVDLAVPRRAAPCPGGADRRRRQARSSRQKPFALTQDGRARTWWTPASGPACTLMVNQQARWAPAHRALQRVHQSGRARPRLQRAAPQPLVPGPPGSWFVRMEHFNILDHGIHYIDLSRYFTGRTPERVKATTTMVPGQVGRDPDDLLDPAGVRPAGAGDEHAALQQHRADGGAAPLRVAHRRHRRLGAGEPERADGLDQGAARTAPGHPPSRGGGSPTPSAAAWASCCRRWRRGASRRRPGATTWTPSASPGPRCGSSTTGEAVGLS